MILTRAIAILIVAVGLTDETSLGAGVRAGVVENDAGQEVVLQEAEDLGWPREFEHDGVRIIIYQPQLETFDGDRLTGRSAVSVFAEGESEPAFGAVWFDAFVETDRENRSVTVVNVAVPRVRFPNASEEQGARLASVLEREIGTWDMVVSLDRILTGLELAERERVASENLMVEPPNIVLATEPTTLVILDGEPVLQDVEESDLDRVVNTPFTIIFDPAEGTYYLYAGREVWFSAADVMGPWALAEDMPDEVAALVPPDTVRMELEGEGEGGADEEVAEVDIEELRLLVVSEPTELIVLDGPPRYESIEGTDLLYIANTESDVFKQTGTERHFIVLAGRWYTSGGLEGSWTFLPSDSLPGSFAEIPPESARGSVLTYVAGTDQAMDAVLDNSIPQTSAVKRAETIEVTFDGEPKFEPIDGTAMKYALNTEYQVLEVGGRYYVCYEAVWYESDDPMGPYRVSVEVPTDVQEIPADNPNYNVKYVYVYDYTPEVVYVGYTPGYTWSYVYGPTVVYGTGYWYRPWVSPYYYYPRPVTWGFRVSYNPWYGWSFGIGVSYGAFHFGFRFGPSYGYRPGGWWGPAGYRYGYHHGYHRGYGSGYRAGYRAGQQAGQRRDNIYRAQLNAPRNADRATARAELANRQKAGGARVEGGQRPDVSRAPSGRQAEMASGRENNVYADRDGNIYRRNEDGNWQQRDRDGWKPVDRSALEGRAQPADRSRATDRQAAPGQPAARPPQARQPETRQQPARQPQTRQPSTRQQPSRSYTPNQSGNLNRESQNRQRGSQRTENYQRSRGSVGARPGAGRRR
ncbi:MAG: hypothetical protein JSU87_06840 [Gemmatimonadota bacterium]|nr:MAG: hypothetical protein JSU87_06840 [Gemmatimonadota bacterium]